MLISLLSSPVLLAEYSIVLSLLSLTKEEVCILTLMGLMVMGNFVFAFVAAAAAEHFRSPGTFVFMDCNTSELNCPIP